MEWVAENQDVIVEIVAVLVLMGLIALRQYVKKTKTTVDDQLLDVAEDVVEEVRERQAAKRQPFNKADK